MKNRELLEEGIYRIGPKRIMSCISLVQPSPAYEDYGIKGGGDRGPMLNLDANGFTRVTNQFSLTLPSPTMISVILLELEYHLHICIFAILQILAEI